MSDKNRQFMEEEIKIKKDNQDKSGVDSPNAQTQVNSDRHPCMLPPIATESYAQKCKPPKFVIPESRQPSSYHRGCVSKDYKTSKVENERKPLKLAKRIPKNVEVSDYLDRNRDFLEAYIINSIPTSQLERWLMKKMSHDPGRLPQVDKHEPISNTFHGTKVKRKIFMELLEKLKEDTNEYSIALELIRRLSMAVGVDAYRVYKLFPDHPNFVQYFECDSPYESCNFQLVRADLDKIKYVLEVTKNGGCLRLSKHINCPFPKIPIALLKTFFLKDEKEANYVMYVPILTANGKTSYVIEMWRLHNMFEDKDEEMASNFVVWGSLILHYCNLYLDKRRERNMSDFLLDVVKAIFEEMVSLDQLIKRILEFAQRLVNADRASLFLVDYRNFELVSTVFDLKFEPGQGNDVERKEIRMPINRGIAGHVALSGETMNIPDAYSDYRFNREVDEVTGYKTISILCMPVKVQGKVIGVVQMVNKRNNDTFDRDDEVSFEIFSTFFGLALHHARLYDKIMRKEQKYRVALEVLSYHNTCREHEVQEILRDNNQIKININDFYLDPYQLDDFQKCKAVISMFDDLFELSRFDYVTVTRFILTVKKNYRAVPYHNFDHGWSVAHAMYVILKNDTRRRFDYKMRLALFVACLCHDLDHRGYTNKYMNETASPLAAMYTTSPLEHHHFNITVTILQQDGHNIFSHLSSEEYKDILRYIRHCILATDLAAFFPNLAKLNDVHESNSQATKFNWAIPGHRDLAMAISMTAADLSASAKPWKIQIKTVKVIFEEFYDQGDKERAAGKIPIPMMDRNKPEEQPASQVGFLSQICIPCYSMLYKILPKTKPMYVMSLKNLNNWKSKVLKTSDSDESSNENTSDIASEIELDEDNVDIEAPVTYSEDHAEGQLNPAMADIDNILQEVQDQEEVQHIKEICGEITAKLKVIQSDSISWEDNIWQDSAGNLVDGEVVDGEGVDGEGVVTGPRKSLKMSIISSEEKNK